MRKKKYAILSVLGISDIEELPYKRVLGANV